MLGTFQQSHLRIEVDAPEQKIRDSLLCPGDFQQWLQLQRFSPGLPERLRVGTVFTSWLGPIAVQHHVEMVEPNGLRLIMNRGIDGFHEWYWGEGWVQSRLEGVSLLPLNLGQTVSLLNLRQFLTRSQPL
ncbi:hypothetical protein IQ268_11570 [Oculatella sp. LEGE 06141]|uniref:hypothetical protein n=1 Tax=Oculatella sp. LEGE 06141 TaxID=1828648 RepID=UPI00187E9B9A|nr:hypothetical protein [Oculatella sp. LEGE 06141]MBE9179200.1 hypothetical protein [Oculatella sp. LEGE 06141]